MNVKQQIQNQLSKIKTNIDLLEIQQKNLINLYLDTIKIENKLQINDTITTIKGTYLIEKFNYIQTSKQVEVTLIEVDKNTKEKILVSKEEAIKLCISEFNYKTRTLLIEDLTKEIMFKHNDNKG